MKLNGLEKYFNTTWKGKIIDFYQKNSSNHTPLMYAILNNKTLQLNSEQWIHIIKNSDLTVIDLSKTYRNNWNILQYMLSYYQQENIFLPDLAWTLLIEGVNLNHYETWTEHPLILSLRHFESINFKDYHIIHIMNKTNIEILTKIFLNEHKLLLKL